jgi:uncharacterized RDD family membrane protein YckC
MEWADEVRMETPEQIELDLELAGLGSRFLAVVVDWLFEILLTLLVATPVVLVLGVLSGGKALDNPSKVLVAVALAGVYFLWLGYAIYFEVKWNGQTPGKWTVGIRAIQQGARLWISGRRPFATCSRRSIFRWSFRCLARC